MAGRKPNESLGSIEKTGKSSWRIRVSLGKDPITGKYLKSPSRSVKGTKAQAKQALVQYRAELMEGTYVAPSKLTVGEYAQQFHEMRESEFKSPLAWTREQYEIDTINEWFGAYLIQEIDTRIIRLTYARQRKEGVSEGKMHRVHQKFSQIMRQALCDEIIGNNPCDPISIPRPAPKERKSLSLGEAQRLNSVLLSLPVSAGNCAVLLALHTGMRRGEVLGLLWKNVHFDKKKLYVAQQYAKDRTPRAPKSEKSKRWLSLDDEVLAYLEKWKVEQERMLRERKERIEREGSPSIAILQTEDSPVATNEYGYYFDPDIFGRWFREFCTEHEFGKLGQLIRFVDDNGIKRTRRTDYTGLNFHELRHTQATLLIGNGADIKTVQNRLGHSSASLTMDIYSHAIEQNDRTAADEIGGLLGGSK